MLVGVCGITIEPDDVIGPCGIANDDGARADRTAGFAAVGLFKQQRYRPAGVGVCPLALVRWRDRATRLVPFGTGVRQAQAGGLALDITFVFDIADQQPLGAEDVFISAGFAGNHGTLQCGVFADIDVGKNRGQTTILPSTTKTEKSQKINHVFKEQLC